MFTQVTHCRICGNSSLERVLDLGDQMLTGVFPRTRDEQVGHGPLRLVKCVGDEEESCGLLQLEHSYDLDEMYGDNYGYRSGLNASMVAHLHRKVERISRQIAARFRRPCHRYRQQRCDHPQSLSAARTGTSGRRSDRIKVSRILSGQHCPDSGFLQCRGCPQPVWRPEGQGHHLLLHVLRSPGTDDVHERGP